MKYRLGLIILGCAAVLALTGCEDMEDLITDSKTVEAAAAEAVEMNVKMGAGELRVSGGAQALMEAEFTHRTRRRAPEVDYRVIGTKGFLSVRQRRGGGVFIGSSRNEWDIRLNSGIPADLKINLGAGESRLDLAEIDLRSLTVDMGVGEMKLDLRGKHERDLHVSIDGGIGSGTIYLPREVGVRVRVDGGIGSVDAREFDKKGHVYTNDAYGKSPVTIDISIDAGIGSIDLRLD
jgi:3-keto-L-gulonate-6-phosphate decarboxylase